MTNLVTDVADTVEEHPDSPAIVYEGTELTYDQFWTRAGQFAQALHDSGIEDGDRVLWHSLCWRGRCPDEPAVQGPRNQPPARR